MRPANRFKPGKARAIIDIFRDVLFVNSGLKRVVKTWQLSRGLDTDDVLPDRWPVEFFPALRLDFETGALGFKTQATQQSNLVLVVTLGIAGTDPRDAADFWEMVTDVLYPCDRSILDALNPSGVHGYVVSEPAIERRRFTDSDAGQIVVGRVTVPYEYRARP